LATASAQVCVPLGHSSLYFIILFIQCQKSCFLLLCFFVYILLHLFAFSITAVIIQ